MGNLRSRLSASAPLVVRVGALLSHLGPEGRPTTQTGALRLVDAKALAEVCGDEERLLRASLARYWLETHGHEVAGPTEPHDELLIFVDIAAMMIDLGERCESALSGVAWCRFGPLTRR